MICLKKEHKMSFSAITKCAPSLTYSTFMRWKDRIEKGLDPSAAPGPKKLESFETDILEGKIRNLNHKRKRTHGVQALHFSYKDAISRRNLYNMVGHIRREMMRGHRLDQWAVEWLQPGVAWALDDAEGRCGGTKFFLHNVQDLCSSYKLEPKATHSLMDGGNVAKNLERLFNKFGPPLFLKRDNGGNLCSIAVMEVLEKYMVFPINSPPYYPQYNGAVEHSQGEYKQIIESDGKLLLDIDEIDLRAKLAAHDLNHKRRRRLSGNNSCSVFFGKERTLINKQKRKETYQWLHYNYLELTRTADSVKDMRESMRVATLAWLQVNGFISMNKEGGCHPLF